MRLNTQKWSAIKWRKKRTIRKTVKGYLIATRIINYIYLTWYHTEIRSQERNAQKVIAFNRSTNSSVVFAWMNFLNSHMFWYHYLGRIQQKRSRSPSSPNVSSTYVKNAPQLTESMLCLRVHSPWRKRIVHETTQRGSFEKDFGKIGFFYNVCFRYCSRFLDFCWSNRFIPLQRLHTKNLPNQHGLSANQY